MIRKHIQLSETIVVYAFVCFASILYFLSNAQPNLYGIDENSQQNLYKSDIVKFYRYDRFFMYTERFFVQYKRKSMINFKTVHIKKVDNRYVVSYSLTCIYASLPVECIKFCMVRILRQMNFWRMMFMVTNRNSVVLSLEHHLFFARMMKEHAIFLEVSFAGMNQHIAKEADRYKVQFEKILNQAVKLSHGVLSKDIIQSAELVTEYTQTVEREVQRFTGISIDRAITAMEEDMQGEDDAYISPKLANQVLLLNRSAIRILDGIIDFEENILKELMASSIFSTSYPNFVKHLVHEAQSYRSYIINFEFSCDDMTQVDLFWDHSVLEHTQYVKAILNSANNELIQSCSTFAASYQKMLDELDQKAACTMKNIEIEPDIAGTATEFYIPSVILPLFADHMLREANHYIRLSK